MQTTIGIGISIIVMAAAFGHAFNGSVQKSTFERIATFIFTVLGVYAAGAVLLGIVWLMLYLGVLFRQAIMWLVEAVFWFMPM